jgi:hypothetical protein
LKGQNTEEVKQVLSISIMQAPDVKMTLSEAEEPRHPKNIVSDLHETSTNTNGSSSSSAKIRSVQEALEAKRATNRQSARRCRLRQKNLIKELQSKNALLTAENRNLRLKLELSQAENKKLVVMQQHEQQRALKRSQALNSIVRQHLQSNPPTATALSTNNIRQNSIPPQSASIVSALLELAGQSPTSTRGDTPELPPSFRSLPERGPELQRSSLSRFPHLNIPSNGLGSDLPTPQVACRDIPGDILSTQQEIGRLREEVKGLRGFLATRNISI